MESLEFKIGNSLLPKRFWDRVVADKHGCWIWAGRLNFWGYADFWANGKNLPAHRYSYEMLISAIPAGLHLDHLCRVRSCVNPAHLEPVTIKQNVLRGDGPSALNARKSECRHGHKYTETNTLINSGRRHCRECAKLKMRCFRSGLPYSGEAIPCRNYKRKKNAQ
jgi:hypothetical protein